MDSKYCSGGRLTAWIGAARVGLAPQCRDELAFRVREEAAFLDAKAHQQIVRRSRKAEAQHQALIAEQQRLFDELFHQHASYTRSSWGSAQPISVTSAESGA